MPSISDLIPCLRPWFALPAWSQAEALRTRTYVSCGSALYLVDELGERMQSAITPAQSKPPQRQPIWCATTTAPLDMSSRLG
jgi:hypothetical protein